MRFGLACFAFAVVLTEAGGAFADDARNLSVGAHVAMDTFGNAVADAAVHIQVGNYRFGLGAQVALPYYSNTCVCVIVTPLAQFGFRLRDTPNLELWLESAIGPVINTALPNPVGLAALVGLDIALPITHRLWFEIVPRAGFDYLSSTSGFLQLAVGVMWNAL